MRGYHATRFEDAHCLRANRSCRTRARHVRHGFEGARGRPRDDVRGNQVTVVPGLGPPDPKGGLHVRNGAFDHNGQPAGTHAVTPQNPDVHGFQHSVERRDKRGHAAGLQNPQGMVSGGHGGAQGPNARSTSGKGLGMRAAPRKFSPVSTLARPTDRASVTEATSPRISEQTTRLCTVSTL